VSIHVHKTLERIGQLCPDFVRLATQRALASCGVKAMHRIDEIDLRIPPMKAKKTCQRYVAFLRGINLGKRRPPMVQLKKLFEELGFEDVETFIASGNIIFRTGSDDSRTLESKIARHLETSLGYDVDTFVRTTEEVAVIGAAKIFPEDSQPGITIHVGFFQEQLPPEMAQNLPNIRTPADEFRLIGRELYWLCRVRSSDSEVWTLPEVKALRLPTVTMRNITSIRKLIAKHIA
jgi:uncharacterized protein (DUF1697 family)